MEEEVSLDDGADAPLVPRRRPSPGFDEKPSFWIDGVTTTAASEKESETPGVKKTSANENETLGEKNSSSHRSPTIQSSPATTTDDPLAQQGPIEPKHVGRTRFSQRRRTLTPCPSSPSSHDHSHGNRTFLSDDHTVSQFPGAIPVLPGVTRNQAHLATLKAAAQEENNTVSGRDTRTGTVTDPSTRTISATAVSMDHQEELEHLRNLVDNAIDAEHVQSESFKCTQATVVASKTRKPRNRPKKKQDVTSYSDPLTPLMHEQECLVDESPDRITECRRLSGMKIIKPKTTWWKAACCGNHAVILDSVIVIDENVGPGFSIGDATGSTARE